VGGYIEPGEVPLETAQRELQEETGISQMNGCAWGITLSTRTGCGTGYLFLARHARAVSEIDSDDLEDQEMLFLSRDELEATLSEGKFKILAWAGGGGLRSSSSSTRVKYDAYSLTTGKVWQGPGGRSLGCRDRQRGGDSVGDRSWDGEQQARSLAEKITNLRIFEDEKGKMNLSLLEVGGEAIVVSQFTLYADTRKGRRPSFTDAALPVVARPLVDHFATLLRELGIPTQTGEFGAHMLVEIANDGP